MKKGQVIEGIVRRVDFPNKGIVETSEGVCVVKNALPGQKVRCAVNKVRKGKAEGRLLEVIAPSVLECGSPCPHFGICGGCTYLSLPYEEQLKIKEAQVKCLLDGVLSGQKEWEFEGIKASPVCFGYRNKMEFSFGDEVKDGPLSLGMHKRGSFYDIVSVPECQIVDEDYRSILRCVKDYFATLQERGIDIRFYHRLRHTGYLRHLLVRKAARTGEILIALVTTTQTAAFRKEISEDEEERLFYKAEQDCHYPVRSEGEADSICQKTGLDGADICKGQGTVEVGSLGQEGEMPEAGNLCQRKEMDEMKRICQGQKTDDGDKSCLHGHMEEKEILSGLKEELLHLSLSGKIVGILHTRNDAVADVVQSDETVVLYGQDYFYEELLGLKFKISQFSFFQTNSLGAEVLYQTAREYIADYIRLAKEDAAGHTESVLHQTKEQEHSAAEEVVGDKIVYDLYSGTGTIAQLMAPVAKKVIGVEIVEEAVEAAKKNAELNGLHNCEFIAGDVLKVLDSIVEKPDVIILDPPRDGIHPKALDKIIRYGVEHILYISCKPTSLVRDLEVFLARGYEVERAVAVDQFPWTGNVETVALLSLKKDTLKIEVTMEPGAESNYTPAEKATYGKIKEYVKEKYGLNVSSLYIAQIKDKCGLDKRDNYNLPKSEDAKVPICPPEKEAAIMDAFRHFGMI